MLMAVRGPGLKRPAQPEGTHPFREPCAPGHTAPHSRGVGIALWGAVAPESPMISRVLHAFMKAIDGGSSTAAQRSPI